MAWRPSYNDTKAIVREFKHTRVGRDKLGSFLGYVRLRRIRSSSDGAVPATLEATRLGYPDSSGDARIDEWVILNSAITLAR